MFLIGTSCVEEYTLDTEFTPPTNLTGPEIVDLSDGLNGSVLLSWDGGGAVNGTYVLYELVMDVQNGDFSEPIHTQVADLGGIQCITLSYKQLNVIARNAGVEPEQTATLKWTVKASKGGISKIVESAKKMTITRGAGISVIPEKLYLYGTATEENGVGGQEFRRSADGTFMIYTKLQAGTINFKNSSGTGATEYYYDKATGKLKEANGDYELTGDERLVKVVVDFNALTMDIKSVNKLCIMWADTDLPIYEDEFTYVGKGDFLLAGKELAIPHRHPGWPEGQYSSDPIYFFKIDMDEIEYIWGSNGQNGATSGTPVINQILDDNTTYAKMQGDSGLRWGRSWRFPQLVQNQKCDIMVHTCKDGMLYHSIELTK